MLMVAAHRDDIKKHIRADQLFGFRLHKAARFGNRRPQGAQALDVLVNRAGADFAAAGIGDRRPAAAPQKRAQHVIAGAQAPRQGKGNMVIPDGVRVDGQVFIRHILAPGAKQLQNFDQRVYVVNIGQIFDGTGIIAQDGCGNHGYSGVFSPADRDLPHERIPALDEHFLIVEHQ